MRSISGALALSALRAHGEAAFSMSPKDLLALQEKDRALLQDVLNAFAQLNAPASTGRMTGDPEPGDAVDVLL